MSVLKFRGKNHKLYFAKRTTAGNQEATQNSNEIKAIKGNIEKVNHEKAVGISIQI